MKKPFLLISLVILGACAKQPENIAAVNIGSGAYANYSCSSLRTEKLQISQELEILSAKQKNVANSDALGVFLLGIPWSSMSGNDQEALISVAKGTMQAIDQRSLAKNCR